MRTATAPTWTRTHGDCATGCAPAAGRSGTDSTPAAPSRSTSSPKPPLTSTGIGCSSPAFLAENHLLHTGAEHGGVPVTLAECDELAPDLGARDGFDLACRFASETLPGIFRQDDPVLDLRLAPNHEVQLRRLLDELPAGIFRTDDALGWTYQFWQAKRKDEVNKSGVKIGARELPAVTQLFTEDYMVEFLLHNSLGA